VIFSNVGLWGAKGVVIGIGPLYPIAGFVDPLTSMFEYGVVDVKDSATEAGRDGAAGTASAPAALCLKLSADFGKDSVSWRLGTRTGKGLESV